MKVMKFGGTSVGSPDRMKEVTKACHQVGRACFRGIVSDVWHYQFPGGDL